MLRLGVEVEVEVDEWAVVRRSRVAVDWERVGEFERTREGCLFALTAAEPGCRYLTHIIRLSIHMKG